MKAKQAEKLEEEDAAQAIARRAVRGRRAAAGPQGGGDLDGFLIQLMDVGFGHRRAAQLFRHAELSVDSRSYRRREWQRRQRCR